MNTWGEYEPIIKRQTKHFILTEAPPTEEGIDTLLLMERMYQLGYVFVVEGFAGLIWRRSDGDTRQM